MAKYVNGYFQKRVYDWTLNKHLIPCWSTAEGGRFYCAIDIKKWNCSRPFTWESTTKNCECHGAPSRVWKALEDVKNDLTLTLSLAEAAINMDRTVLLLGHAFQAATYYHRFNAFSSFMEDHRKLKETLKEKADSKGAPDYLEINFSTAFITEIFIH